MAWYENLESQAWVGIEDYVINTGGVLSADDVTDEYSNVTSPFQAWAESENLSEDEKASPDQSRLTEFATACQEAWEWQKANSGPAISSGGRRNPYMLDPNEQDPE